MFLLVFNFFILAWGTLDIVGDFYPVVYYCLSAPIRLRILAVIDAPRIWSEACRRRTVSSTHTMAFFIWTAAAIALRMVAVAALAFDELIMSRAFDLCRVWTVPLQGTVSVFSLRSEAMSSGLQGAENTWGFGQAVPVIMLALPLFNVLEIYYGMYCKVPLLRSLGKS